MSRPNINENDFSAIDKYIDWEQKNNNRLLHQRNARNWNLYSKAIAIVLVSMGMMALLICIALFILKQSEEPIKYFSFNDSKMSEEYLDEIYNLLKDLEMGINALELNGAMTESEILSLIQSSESENPLSSVTTKETIQTQFTVFETVGDVVTGRNYSPDNLKRPIRQYCYHDQGQIEQNKSVHVDLATKNGENEIEYAFPDNVIIKKQVQEYCRFI